jgi:two-component system, OmpR family, sensor histidine kinase MprB
MSLRLRITLGLAALAALVSIIGATGAYLRTHDELHASLDESLVSRRDLASFEIRGSNALPCPPVGAVQPATAAQVLAVDGSSTQCFEEGVLLPVDASDRRIAAEGGPDRLRTATVDGRDYRILTVAAPNGGALQIARSLGETDDVMASLRLQLIGLSLGATLLGALLGWLFARRTVAPIVRLRGVAEHIARTEDLAATVPGGGGDEVGSLAQSFSAMVTALDRSRRQQQRLITDASHELRTPLTSLRTNADLLNRAERLTPQQRAEVADGIRAEVDELTNLVTELVELATSPGADEPAEPLDLADLADDVATRARRRSSRTIDVVKSGDNSIVGRPAMIDRAVTNLVDNALKYSEGPVEIVVIDRRLEVRDNGPGITAEDQPRVFDRFFRAAAARAEPGSGLGLAIVAQVVGLHGGTVWATNRTDAPGAAVGFDLPDSGLELPGSTSG